MRVLVLSHTTGYQLRAFDDAAGKLGVELAFATDRCHALDDPWQDRAIAVRFHELNASVDAVVESARPRPIDGVIAVGDRPVVLAARVAEVLKLPWHSVQGALASSDKHRSRIALAGAGLPSPRFRILDSGSGIKDSRLRIKDPGFELSGFEFPVVLKPLGLSGSRGVIRANDEREFEAAFKRIRALLSRPQIRSARTGLDDQILVERYVDGREVAVEGVLTQGVFQVFAIFDKPDPLEGPFFEETIYVTPSALEPDLQVRLLDHIRRGAAALGLRHGPVHAECRVTPAGEIYLLEIAGRPIGGLCSQVLTLVRAECLGRADTAEASLEEVLLRHSVGESIDGWTREVEGAAVMMIPIPARGIYRGARGEHAARAVPGVTDVRISAKVGQLLEPLPEAGSYLGFIFAKGRNAPDAEAAVRTAHRRLRFEVAREVAVNREA